MNRCLDCGHLFEDGEEKRVEERHGFDHGPFEQFSYCPACGGDYIEVQPCAICGAYPGEEYEDDEESLPNGGICKACFESGIDEHFDEYLDDEDLSIEFYIGELEIDGYAYDANQIVEILRREYAELAKVDPGKVKRARMDFILDGDSDAFGEWLIARE